MKYTNIVMATLGAGMMIFASAGAMADDIMVKNAWARASAGMAGAGAAFMEIENMGGQNDKLISASSDISAKTELHTHIMDGDIMRMRQVDFIPVPSGSTELRPGGYHVMFMGLKNMLVEGTSFPLTLTFEKAGNIDLTVNVMSPAAKGAMEGMGHKNMEKMNKAHGGKMKHN
ncbi:MAG: copper chaperone PCu(A)C [Rhodospirillaceae bacterium]|nr:copper chaperone PCu(A)C [Rhodospirillaceae bacterium]